MDAGGADEHIATPACPRTRKRMPEGPGMAARAGIGDLGPSIELRARACARADESERRRAQRQGRQRPRLSTSSPRLGRRRTHAYPRGTRHTGTHLIRELASLRGILELAAADTQPESAARTRSAEGRRSRVGRIVQELGAAGRRRVTLELKWSVDRAARDERTRYLREVSDRGGEPAQRTQWPCRRRRRPRGWHARSDARCRSPCCAAARARSVVGPASAESLTPRQASKCRPHVPRSAPRASACQAPCPRRQIRRRRP